MKLCSKNHHCSTKTNLRLTFHLSCITWSRFPTFPDSSPDSVSFEQLTLRLTLDLWRSAFTDLVLIVLDHAILLESAVAVAVNVIAATIIDQHVLKTRESCDLAMVSRACLLDSARLRRHPTSSDQEFLGSASISVVSASVSDLLQFHVFLEHSLLPNCHCRFVSGHRSSSLDHVIEFPSSCTLLESKRSTQLLRLIMRQAFANMTCVSASVCLS